MIFRQGLIFLTLRPGLILALDYISRTLGLNDF